MEIHPGIKNIIFDLGGVLLDLDFTAPIRSFQQLGASVDFLNFRKSLKDPVFFNLETGIISPEEFRGHIREMLENNGLSDEAIDEAWCSILGSVPAEKVILLQELAKVYRLFLYSNTNQIHIGYFRRRFQKEHHLDFETIFEKVFYSHEIHDRKPQRSGYEKVIAMSGIVPAETLFVDDFEENIRAARDAGLNVYHYQPGTDLALAFIPE